MYAASCLQDKEKPQQAWERCKKYGVYEIDHCTAFGPCSTRHMTPTSS